MVCRVSLCTYLSEVANAVMLALFTVADSKAYIISKALNLCNLLTYFDILDI